MPTPDLLLTSAHRLAVAMHEELDVDRVSSMALLAMRVLAHAQSREVVSPRMLAAQLGCSRSSTTELIDRLVRDGFAQRLAEPNDGRAKRLVLTEHGDATAKASSEALERCMRSFTQSFEDEEREQLGVLLDKLDRGADWHRTMHSWRTYDSSSRKQRRPPSIHIR